MKLMKSILIHILIVLILLMACFSVYYSCKYELPVYADSTIEEWTQVTTNDELVTAFRYYCKSRNLTIDGSVADAVTTFTTQRFNQICNTLGLDITALQAHLKRSTDNNNRIQFLFDETGITAYNRIFAEFLQNNNLEVGDTADEQNNTVFDGTFFVTDNGKGCLVFRINQNVFSSSEGNFNSANQQQKSLILEYGTFLDNGSEIAINSYKNYSFTINGRTYSGNKNSVKGSDKGLALGRFTENGTTYLSPYDMYWAIQRSDSSSLYGGITVMQFNNALVIGTIGINMGWGEVNTNYFGYQGTVLYNQQQINTPPATVYYTTNNQTINNNTYEGDTIINNEGDIVNEGDDINYNPYPNGGGTVTSPSDSGGSDGDVTFPNFNFQLPEIDWSLGDLHDKFPFSIPFDLVEFLTVLNAEPITPEFAGDLNLGILTHHFEFDLHQFDGLAELLRAMEFIGFCIGLIYITRQMLRV